MVPLAAKVMRRKLSATLLFFVMGFALCSPFLSSASARSVYETADYDLFLRGI